MTKLKVVVNLMTKCVNFVLFTSMAFQPPWGQNKGYGLFFISFQPAPLAESNSQVAFTAIGFFDTAKMAVRHKAVSTLPNLIRSLRKDSPKPNNHALPSLRRTFSLYDQINLIDQVPEDQLRFQGYLSKSSFCFANFQ